MRVVVTGGAGFIGSAVCRALVAERGATVLNIDALTASSSLASLAPIAHSPRYTFRRSDICDSERIAALLHAFAPDALVHAAFDKSAAKMDETLQTNVLGTWRVLEATRDYWATLPLARQNRFRFVAASSLSDTAGRIAADELVSAWYKSYALPTIVSKAAETFGPYQFPSHTIPAAVIASLEGGRCAEASGEAADWLYVEDHARALLAMLETGTPGATYHVAGKGRLRSPLVLQHVQQLVERSASRRSASRAKTAALSADETIPLTEHSEAAAASSRLAVDTGWRSEETAETALAKTVRWYLANEGWWRPLHAAAAGDEHWGLLRTA